MRVSYLLTGNRMQGGMKPERAESGISTEYRLALPVGSPQNAAVSLMLWRGHNSARNFPMSDGPQKPRVVDNPDVGELYANKTIGASFDGGGITVLLGCSRVIPELSHSPRAQRAACRIRHGSADPVAGSRCRAHERPQWNPGSPFQHSKQSDRDRLGKPAPDADAMGVRTRGLDIKAGAAKLKADRAAPRLGSSSIIVR
jgi:hypothetical protein